MQRLNAPAGYLSQSTIGDRLPMDVPMLSHMLSTVLMCTALAIAVR